MSINKEIGMSATNSIEKRLDEIFVKNAPALPAGGKKFLVEYLPWISLVVGAVTLLMVINLWHWAHVANGLINYANQISAAYGGTKVGDRLTVTIWLSMAVLVIEAVLYLAAFSGLKNKKKAGWNLLFYALLVNVVYGIIALFNNYGGIGDLLGSVIGFAIGAYFLFQIRASYK